MQVFKAYFQVARGSLSTIGIFFAVFLGMAIMFTFLAPQSMVTIFAASKIPVAVVNRDADAVVAQALVAYLAKHHRVAMYPDDKEKLQDALFYRQVEYIAIIPAGFSVGFMQDQDVNIHSVKVPHAASGHYVDLSINRFLNTLRLHKDFAGTDQLSSLIEATNENLSVSLPVSMKAAASVSDEQRPAYSYYFAFCSYALLGMVLSGVCAVMRSFNREEISWRIQSAPLAKRVRQLQLFGGHLSFALACWFLLFLIGLLLHVGSLPGKDQLGLYAGNMLVFALVCGSLGLLLGQFIKTANAQAGIVNVTSLALSFLGGVFVPQAIMSPTVLKVSQSLPTYWYIRANDAISSLTLVTADSLRPIHKAIAMQLVFVIVLLSFNLLLSRERTPSQRQLPTGI